MFSGVQVANAIDTVLDRTIALGSGDVGLHVRRHLPGWAADPPWERRQLWDVCQSLIEP